MKLNGAFRFLISCFVSEIFKFLKHANQGSLDVIYSRIVSYIYEMMNISGCNCAELFLTLHECSDYGSAHY